MSTMKRLIVLAVGIAGVAISVLSMIWAAKSFQIIQP